MRTSPPNRSLAAVCRVTVVAVAGWLMPGQMLATVRYVDANSASPAPPYTSWATAAVTTQDAIDAAAAGDEIVVTNGVYATGGRAVHGTMTNRVAVTKPLTVRSVNGPEFTVIRGYQVPGTTNGDGAIRCVYLTNGATLSGFTLTNGATRKYSDNYWQEACGGGLWCESAASVVSNCVITGNTAVGRGGGALAGTLNNCSLNDNWASQGGGGGEVALNNCRLTRNSAYEGGGVYFGTMNNCTLTGNSAYKGGGVYISTLSNCILYFNAAEVGANYYSGDLSYCCTTPASSGFGNIWLDPQLTSASHISATSPCRGAGRASFSRGTDIDGEAWANPPAIGCDEYHAGSVAGPLSVGIGASFTSVAPGFPVNLTALIAGRPTASVWDFGDGMAATNQPYTTHAWTTPGDYVVVLSAFNDSHPQGVSATLTVHIHPAVYYVSAGNANPLPPYTSWATAATNIQAAVDAAAVGGLVLVSNGVYATGARAAFGPNRVAVTRPLTVRSVNGPEHTVVDGGRSVRCVYLTNGVTFAGFTLTNGVADDGGGVRAESGSAVVSNCVVTGNSAGYGGGVSGGTLNNCVLQGNAAEGAGGGAYLGTLSNCTLTENSAKFQGGGGADYCTLNNCVLTGNSAYYGGGASGSELNNCTITGNRATSPYSWGGGGGAYGGTLRNCIVYFNTAQTGANHLQCSLSLCCTTPLPEYSIDNIALNPQLASASHLSAGSPCRGAGSAEYTTGTDIDGEAWADPPSIGCDEFHAAPAAGPLSVSIAASFNNVAAGFTVNFTGSILGRAASNIWDFGDGTVVHREVFQSSASHSWTNPGDYSVVLRAFNQTHPGGISATVTVHVVARPVHYVSAASTNPVAPYTSWATAATTIQAAVDPFGAGTVPGALVLVADGIYATGGSVGGDGDWSRVVVGLPLTVRSVNGPQFTVIDGIGSGRCVYLAGDASLCGFTLTNGAANSGGGLFCESTSATVSNCVVVNNWAYEGGGAYGGSLHHCLLTGNLSSGRGGGACGSTLNHCRVEGNQAEYSNGGGASDSTLNSCTVTGNTANEGGGAYRGILNNCVLAGNTASVGGGASGDPGCWYECPSIPIILNNCSITGNSAEYSGGGVTLGKLNNCTVTGNSATRFGGGVVWGSLTNCIVYFNSAPSGANHDVGSMDYCCTTPDPGGIGNITLDPQLASASHLSAGSPCRGAGSAAYATGTDIDGQAWANPPAIGCDEFYPGATTGPLRVAVQADYTNVQAGFTVNLTGSILGRAASNSWDFGDGTIVQSQLFQPLVAQTWTYPGDYPVILRAYNEDHPGGISATVTVHVEATPVRQFTTLVAFNQSRGLWPNGKLLLGKDGSFYGTTASGGSGGRGTVFKVTTNGLLTTLVSFAGNNGAEPTGGLVWGLDGNLYGTTRFGNRSDKGTVFKATINGMLTMLAAFTGGNGTEPLGGLTLGSDGNFYGTTGGSYANGYRDGTVFKVTTNGALTTLVRFTGDNGANPEAGLVLSGDGSFYGTTFFGGMGAGTVFTVTTNGVLTTLVSFAGGNGAHPLARLVWGPGGNLYGTTLQGGSHGSGTVFRMTSNGVLSTLVSFTGWDGARPAAELLLGSDGSFYGTTWAGGRHTAVDGEGYGTVFRVTTNGVLTSLVSFQNFNGANPSGGLSLGSDGYLYGTTYGGGPDGGGTIFRFYLNRAPTAVAMASGMFAISNNATNLIVLSPNSSNATIVLNGSQSLDLDNDQLRFIWYANTQNGLLATGMVAVVTVPVGTNPVQLVVSDGFASSTNTITVTVLTTGQGVQRLIALVSESNLQHPQPLVATLAAALASLERGDLVAAANQLRAFQNQVRAQVAPENPALADALIVAAQQLIDALGGRAGGPGGRIQSVQHQPGGKVRLKLTGPAGGVQVVQASTNLLSWETLGVAVDHGDGQFEFEDAQASRFPNRYYRLVSR